MYLDPYILEVGQPNKWRYFPCTFQGNINGEIVQSTVTLDILKTDTGIHSLISYPSWGNFPIDSELLSLCKHIFHFMELSSWTTKDTAFWYVLYWLNPGISISQTLFEDNWVRKEEKRLSFDQVPFNLKDIENL